MSRTVTRRRGNRHEDMYPGGYMGRYDAGSGAQWDDAGNLLVLAPETVVSYERNVLTNARLEDAGIEVIRVPGGELACCRGGPRAICCPLAREPASMPDENARRLRDAA
jgi:arginine deiminase